MTTRDEFIEARLREELDFGKITIEVAAASWVMNGRITCSNSLNLVRLSPELLKTLAQR